MITFRQHPQAKIKRTEDWSTWLGGATVASSEWIAPDLTVSSEAESDGVASAILAAPAEGETAIVTNRVIASDGRQRDRNFRLLGAVDVLGTENKDPDDVAVLTYDASFFDPDLTVTDSDWDVPAGLTNDLESRTATAGLVQVSGGTTGQTYRLTGQLDLSSGERIVGVIDVYVTEG